MIVCIIDILIYVCILSLHRINSNLDLQKYTVCESTIFSDCMRIKTTASRQRSMKLGTQDSTMLSYMEKYRDFGNSLWACIVEIESNFRTHLIIGELLKSRKEMPHTATSLMTSCQ